MKKGTVIAEHQPILDYVVGHFTKNPSLPLKYGYLYNRFKDENEKFSKFTQRIDSVVRIGKKRVVQKRKAEWESRPELHERYRLQEYVRLYPEIQQHGPPRPVLTPKGKPYLPYVPKKSSVHSRSGLVRAVQEYLIDHPGKRLITSYFAKIVGVNPNNETEMRSLHISIDQIVKRILIENPHLFAVRKRGGPRFKKKSPMNSR